MDAGFRIFAILAASLLGGAAPTFGNASWIEGFNGPQTSWREAGSDAQYRIARHERKPADGRNGTGCEAVSLEGSTGTYVHLEHAIGSPLVIDELRPSLWIRADRAGLQVAARVVLPRTPDPRTGTPVSTLVLGGAYTDVGRWQQLSVDSLPQRLARQVRSLRAELGAAVDDREAFVDAIILNVYGGPGITNTWIDDLEIAGHVEGRLGGDVPTPLEAANRQAPLSLGDTPIARPPVALSGGVLTVAGRPFFPRAVQYRGEPLEQLRDLGFNAVWSDTPPSGTVLADASRLGLWLICPPPDSINHAPGNNGAVGPFEIGLEYDTVLAWCVGRGLTAAELEPVRGRIERIRAADRTRRRPIVCGVVGELRGFSRHVDVLLLDRRPLGTSLELRDYGHWLQRQPRLARPGTPVWTTVQTQPSPALYEQLAAMDPGRTLPTAVPHEQIALLARTALGAGSRGLLFVTESDFLDADHDVRRRAMALELVNLELSLLEPWIAAGTFQAAIEAGGRDATGSVLRVSRSQLALPLWSSAGAQYVPGQPSAPTLAIVVPGVPESANVYEIVPGGLGSTKHQRITGGTQLTLEGFGLWSSLVVAQDALLVSQLSGRAGETGPRASQLYHDLATDKLRTAVDIQRQLPSGAVPDAETTTRLREAQEQLRLSSGYLAAREYRQAIQAARKSMRIVGMLERRHWETAVAALSSPVTSPGACSFATLPWHGRLGERIQASQYGQNQLVGGDFERLNLLLQSGWQHMEHAAEGCVTAADLVVEAKRSGNTGLRMTVSPTDPKNPPAVVEMPPIWIVTPPVPVEAGQLVVIHGYANVPQPVSGSVDGLMIFDSISGEGLAERIGRTKGWRAFTLFRVAPRSGSLRVTFALTGLGEARIDDVTIRALHPGAPPATARQSDGVRNR